MIWTEEENSIRSIDTMSEPKGKTCLNCHWGEGSVKPEDRDQEWTVCGHHHQCFSIESLCAYWTNPKDPRLKHYIKKRQEEMKLRLKKQKS